jgi:hypothetical protein
MSFDPKKRNIPCLPGIVKKKIIFRNPLNRVSEFSVKTHVPVRAGREKLCLHLSRLSATFRGE